MAEQKNRPQKQRNARGTVASGVVGLIDDGLKDGIRIGLIVGSARRWEGPADRVWA
jgi:hypothetical protein